jgi:hypothetical protein
MDHMTITLTILISNMILMINLNLHIIKDILQDIIHITQTIIHILDQVPIKPIITMKSTIMIPIIIVPMLRSTVMILIRIQGIIWHIIYLEIKQDLMMFTDQSKVQTLMIIIIMITTIIMIPSLIQRKMFK